MSKDIFFTFFKNDIIVGKGLELLFCVIAGKKIPENCRNFRVRNYNGPSILKNDTALSDNLILATYLRPSLVGLGGGELQGCKSVGEGANEGGGPGSAARGGKRPRGGREHGRLRLIRGRPPSSLFLFLPSTLSSSTRPSLFRTYPAIPPSPRHDLTNSLCTFCPSFFSRRPLAVRSARFLLA